MYSDLEKRLRATWRRLDLPAGVPLVAAVSGGADSTALLDALVRMRQEGADLAPGALTVAHFNHLLRGAEANEDEQFAEALARRYRLPFAVAREEIAAEAARERRNLEAVARERRYRFLAQTAREAGARLVATAHTRDDQVETILLRLLRGAGPEGLGGMRPRRRLVEGIELIRPLLPATRREVLAHCAHYGLEYRTDSTNLSPSLTRNRVRLTLLPLLHSINPRFDEALVRASALIREDDEYLSGLAGSLLSEAQVDGALDLRLIAAAPAPLRRRALREWLRRERGDLRRIDRAHLDALDSLSARGQSGRRVELPGGSSVIREFDRLIFAADCEDWDEQKGEEPSPVPQPVREGTETRFGAYRLTVHRRLRGEQAEALLGEMSEGTGAILGECAELDALLVRTRRAGDVYIPVGSNRALKVNKLMIRARLPLRARKRHPLVVTAAGEILWAPGLPLARRFLPEAGSQCALIAARPLAAPPAMQPNEDRQRL